MTDALNDSVWAGLALVEWGTLLAVIPAAYVMAWLVVWPVSALGIARAGGSQIIPPTGELRDATSAGTLVWIALAWAGVRSDSSMGTSPASPTPTWRPPTSRALPRGPTSSARAECTSPSKLPLPS